MDGDVLLSAAWIAGDHHAGGKIWAAVVLVVHRQREQLRKVDIPMHNFLGRRGGDFVPGKRMQRRLLVARKHCRVFHSHGLRYPAAVGN